MSSRSKLDRARTGTAMKLLETRADRASDDFRANAAHLRGLVADLRARLARVREGGGAQAASRHLARG